MSNLIAVAGKGGVGKTTVAALTVMRLIQRGAVPCWLLMPILIPALMPLWG